MASTPSSGTISMEFLVFVLKSVFVVWRAAGLNTFLGLLYGDGNLITDFFKFLMNSLINVCKILKLHFELSTLLSFLSTCYIFPLCIGRASNY